MRGFRPQNDANGGAVPFGARGLNELRSLIPQMESMGYKQAQPQVQQPQDNRGAAGLKAIIPQMEAMGYKQQPQQYFADGGFVQGIKRAFGMDEERNAQIAAYRARAAAEKAQAAQQQQAQQPQQPQQRAISDYSGMSATQRREKELGLADGGRVRPRGFVAGKGTATSDSIPARLSNGEYVLPADTVRAVGVEALDALRESTHKPVKGEQANAARGFFAGGTPGGLQKAYDDWQDKKTPWYMPTPRGNMEERTAEANYTDALKNHYSDQQSAPTLTSPAVTPAAPAQNPTDARLAAGTQTSPMSGAMNQPKPQPKPQPDAQGDTAATTAREVVPGVFNHGRGQYSDDPNGMNMPKGFTGQPSAQNNAILQRMSDQSQAESMARVGMSQYDAEVQRAKNINADEAARNNSVGARMQRLADPFTAEGRAMRNLQMNIDSSLDRNGRPTAETAALVAQSKAMSDGYLAEPNQQRTIDAGLQREGMQQAGATERAARGFAVDQQRVGIEGRRADSEIAARGFQTRAAGRLEKLQDGYLAAKTPEERAIFARQIQELSPGKADEANARMEVVRGSVDPTTGKRDGDYAVIFDPKTQTARQVPVGGAQAQQPSAAPKAGEVRNGYRFKGGNPNDQANWAKV